MRQYLYLYVRVCVCVCVCVCVYIYTLGSKSLDSLMKICYLSKLLVIIF